LIRELCDLLELLFGPSESWDSESQVFDVSGAQDIIISFFNKQLFDPYVVSRGLHQVRFVHQCSIPTDVSERLDKLLGSLESQQYVCGNGTMLSLATSVVHSRMPIKESRLILQYLKIRPLGNTSMRFTPIYSNGSWHALYIVRIQSHILSILTFMDVAFSLIQPQVEFFENSLVQSRLEIPTEVSSANGRKQFCYCVYSQREKHWRCCTTISSRK
jgi:hypothetical protein